MEDVALKPSHNETETGIANENVATELLPVELYETPDTKLYKRRYAVLLVFCLGVFCNAFSFVQYSVVTHVMSNYYGVSKLALNFTGLVYSLGFVLAMIPAIVIYENGLKLGILVGLTGNALGTCLKCAGVGPGYFWLVMIGQSIMGVSQTYFLTLTPYVASVWFGCDESSTAAAAGVFSNCLGTALCSVLVPFILYGSNGQLINRNLSYLLYTQSVVACVALFLALIVLRDQPEKPPSLAQAVARNIKNKKKSLLRNMISIAKNKNIILLSLSFSISYAIISTLSTLLNQMILNVYGPGGSKHVGFIILTLQLSNLVAAIVTGVLLDKTKKFKVIVYVMFISSFVCVATFTGIIYTNIVAVYFVSVLTGFFIGGVITAGLEICTEMSYPCSEVAALGLAGIIGNVVTLIFMFTCAIVIQHFGELAANLGLVGGYIISFILLSKYATILVDAIF